jgi:predicted GNAT family N-acyltransferase
VSEAATFRWVSDAPELERALAIRRRVFCEEQGVAVEVELDGLDDSSLHLLALGGRESIAVGTLRLRVDGPVALIGRIAVAREWRRRGIAAQMIEIALARAREERCRRARLAAQVVAQPLYEHAGFSVESDPFDQVGITHVWMGREL